MNSFEFYKGRIESSPSYGLKSGHEILDTVIRCVFSDSSLTKEEFNSIMKYADMAYIKMLEDDYNEGWK